MEAQDFIDQKIKDSKIDYGLCPPPTTSDEGMEVLIKHFLGDDWYSTMPMSQEQVYTEAIYKILERNKKSKFRKFLELLFD